MRAKRAWKIWNWTVASKHVIIECERAGKFFKLNCRKQKIFGKFCTFPPNSSKLRSDYLFSFQKRTKYLFPVIFKVRIFISKKCQAPSSESNGRPLSKTRLQAQNDILVIPYNNVFQNQRHCFLKSEVLLCIWDITKTKIRIGFLDV